ncbi:hypothetical protein B0H13DRAFT_2661930 [Mycena leptocephala]|nr:hypothetical protein B0H13DRAFT_2661930 [Mycena leptocephala]
MLLLNICNAWTAIALSAPTLWAAIHIAHLRAESIKKILPIWLHRAGNRPLSLSFGASIDHEVAAIIWGHGEQLKHLKICCDKKHYEDRNGNHNIDGDPIVLFGASPVLKPLPLLETLTICGSTTGHSHSIFQILELLRAAPNLVECVFDRTYPAYRIESIAGTLVLPTLRRLTFGKTERHNKFLPYLSLPMLEVLSFPLYHFDDVISLLERSSPPLRELVTLIDGVEFTRVAECLHLVPTLMRLEVRWPATHLATELYAALADSPSLLPNLIGLTVRLHAYATSALSWKTLLRALSARRTQLRVVHVKLTQESSRSSNHTADIIASFRELAADGMELYIGTEGCNFVSG